jgi:hypothetical protein
MTPPCVLALCVPVEAVPKRAAAPHRRNVHRLWVRLCRTTRPEAFPHKKKWLDRFPDGITGQSAVDLSAPLNRAMMEREDIRF